MDGNSLNHSEPGKGRYKGRSPDNWKKTKQKIMRNKPKTMPLLPTCGHNSTAYQCAALSRRDVQHFQKIVYQVPDKSTQDNVILKYCSASTPKRNRQVKENSSRKGIVVKYFVKKATLRPGMPSKVPVCQNTFLGILGISKTRVQHICKRHYCDGEGVLIEKRGGDTRSRHYVGKRAAISAFIEKLKPIEKHYCRGNSKRVYLPSELSINRLWRMYNEFCEDRNLKVKKYFFRQYVRRTYNIGFGQPAQDVCSFCLQTKHLIACATTAEEKQKLITAKRIHRLKFKEFFKALQTREDDTMILSYDCQKNHVLPKVPDQKAYYSRQLYIYNFTVCRGTSKDPLNKDTVFIYNWLENEFPKGCNEIASCVFHNLSTVPIPPTVSKVRLFADGCGGQNKNSLIVGMGAKWLLDHAPEHVTQLEFYFPVVGHSYLPADRVFARIEKRVRKIEEIIHPQEYINIFEENGTVYKLGQDCQNFNWKGTVPLVQKKPGQWHFKFNECKRILLKRSRAKNTVFVRGEVNYRCDLSIFRTVLKRGASYGALDPPVVNSGKPVNADKIHDVEQLLKAHFGVNWKQDPALTYYRTIVEGPVAAENEDGENLLCHGAHPEDPTQLNCV